MIHINIYDINNNPHNKILDLTYSQFDILMRNINLDSDIIEKISNYLMSISSEKTEFETFNLNTQIYLSNIYFVCTLEMDEFIGGFYLPDCYSSLIVNKIIFEK
jgi:hypothetical protein